MLVLRHGICKSFPGLSQIHMQVTKLQLADNRRFARSGRLTASGSFMIADRWTLTGLTLKTLLGKEWTLTDDAEREKRLPLFR